MPRSHEGRKPDQATAHLDTELPVLLGKALHLLGVAFLGELKGRRLPLLFLPQRSDLRHTNVRH